MQVERGSDAAYVTGLARSAAIWSAPMALVIALLGIAVAHDVRFAVSCLIGAAFDVVTALLLLRRATGVDPHDALTKGPIPSFLVTRSVAKGLLLVVAALLPRWLSLLGMAVGVLVVELTLASAGAVATAWRTFQPRRSGA